MYNNAIATSNTNIIVNSVIVLFVMEIDEYIFAAFNAINDKWTAHAAESEEVAEMKKELERQRAQIASQQEQIDNQREDVRMLRETVEKIQEAQASAVATLTTSDIEGAECEIQVDAEQMGQAHQITLPCLAEDDDVKEIQVAAAATTTSDIESAECEIQVDAEQMGQAHQIILPCLAEDEDDEVKECKPTNSSSKNTSS